MINTSFINTTNRTSMILGQSQLKPQNGNIKKKAVGLMITSLVDAFSILVIYLLFGPSISGESIKPEYGVQLPIAFKSSLTNEETILLVKNDRYYLKDKELSVAQLGPALKQISQKLDDKSGKALVIYADQKNDIEKINPVLIAASEAGLTQLRLAVEHQGD